MANVSFSCSCGPSCKGPSRETLKIMGWVCVAIALYPIALPLLPVILIAGAWIGNSR